MSWTDALQQAEEALNDCSEDTHGCPKTLALLVALVEYAQALRNYAGERDEMVETLRKAITQVNEEMWAYKQGIEAMFNAWGKQVRYREGSALEFLVQCDEYPIEEQDQE